MCVAIELTAYESVRIGKGMKKLQILIGVIILFTLCGCAGEKTEQAQNIYKVYYINRDETKITGLEYATESNDPDILIKELMGELGTAPSDVQYKSILSGFSVLDVSQKEGQLQIVVDEHYKELSPTTEVLVRAAIVRTMTQIDGVKYVSMQVRDEPLTDSMGNTIGTMSPEMFIDNAGNEINTYEKVKLALYFANKEGDHLIKANRTVVYNSNISIEKLVVEQLIMGPASSQVYPVVNPDTKIIGVTVKDGICYVNLSEEFLKQTYQVSAEVTIYSITDSLVELPNVNKVQFSINGDTNKVFGESYKLTTVFDRNLELLK